MNYFVGKKGYENGNKGKKNILLLFNLMLLFSLENGRKGLLMVWKGWMWKEENKLYDVNLFGEILAKKEKDVNCIE